MAIEEGRKNVGQYLFSSTLTFDSSGAYLHPMAFLSLEDLLLPAWGYEAYFAFIVSHSLSLPPTRI